MKNETQLEFNFTDKNESKFKDIIIPDDFDKDYKYYQVNKYMDCIFDTIPYGWRIYHKYCDVRLFIVSSYQKLRYGTSNEECWSLDVTLAKYIHKKLVYFKKMKRYGYPSNIMESSIKYHPISEKEEKILSDKWESILDEIIWTFDYIIDEYKYNPIPKMRKWDSKNESFSDYFNREKTPEEKLEWDNYTIKFKELEERKKKGLELFALHLQSLWD